MVPVLFITGVVFCYFVVLTPAMQFLLNFNADEFNTQVRARDYYSFVTLLMLAMGLGFQIPVGDAGARASCASPRPEKLRRGRRYAIVVIVVLAVAAADDRPAHADPRVDPAATCSTSSSICSRGRAWRAGRRRPSPDEPRRRAQPLAFAPMLFDLRGRRRRAVQATYLTLAVLMGGGLVLFGIGGDVSGGLVRRVQRQRQRQLGQQPARRSASTRRRSGWRRRPTTRPRWPSWCRLNYQAAASQTPSGSTTIPEDGQGRPAQGGRLLGALREGRPTASPTRASPASR